MNLKNGQGQAIGHNKLVINELFKCNISKTTFLLFIYYDNMIKAFFKALLQ